LEKGEGAINYDAVENVIPQEKRSRRLYQRVKMMLRAGLLKKHLSAKRAECSAQATGLCGIETQPFQSRYSVKNDKQVRGCGGSAVGKCLYEVEEGTKSVCPWLDMR
jgi:hypothetical protein